jgi:hypothetical protein
MFAQSVQAVAVLKANTGAKLKCSMAIQSLRRRLLKLRPSKGAATAPAPTAMSAARPGCSLA